MPDRGALRFTTGHIGPGGSTSYLVIKGCFSHVNEIVGFEGFSQGRKGGSDSVEVESVAVRTRSSANRLVCRRSKSERVELADCGPCLAFGALS